MNTTTSYSRWRGSDRGRKRQRPQRVEVVKCDACGTVYDVMPYNKDTGCPECPKCHADDSWLRKTWMKD